MPRASLVKRVGQLHELANLVPTGTVWSVRARQFTLLAALAVILAVAAIRAS